MTIEMLARESRTSTSRAEIGLADRVHSRLFNALYSRSLVYTTCWEDPAVDRVALKIRPEDHVMAITSAGCNVLDYALDEPRRIDAVDANPRQTALLELKLAGIRRLSHDDFFSIFGQGFHLGFDAIYQSALRAQLSPFARNYWDQRRHWFSAELGGFVEYRAHWLRLSVEARQGLSDDTGLLGTASARYETRVGPARISVGPQLAWGDDDYMQTYFGITPTQAAASTLSYAPYAAASGVKSYGVGLSIVSPISGPWGIAAIANVNRLTGDAEDSPIVADQGSATQFNAGVFLSYRF